MKILSLITARGGSKEIPKKNLIKIKGKPLIYYSINASLKSKVSQTWVSSDSDEILSVASSFGAKTIDRDISLSNDKVMTDPTLVDFAHRVKFDYLVFIQPTSPLIKPEYINKGLDLIINNNLDSVFSVTKEHWLPRWNNKVEPIDWNIFNRPRRQDKNSIFVENGMFYITSVKNLLKNKLRYGGKMEFVEIPLKDSFQLDTNEDLELLNKLL
tara:strand:+ start:283 stop:921 length:639 start_codon:yes stop_codon:yes gene_type:complete